LAIDVDEVCTPCISYLLLRTPPGLAFQLRGAPLMRRLALTELLLPLENVQPPILQRFPRFRRFVILQLNAFDRVGLFRQQARSPEIWFLGLNRRWSIWVLGVHQSAYRSFRSALKTKTDLVIPLTFRSVPPRAPLIPTPFRFSLLLPLPFPIPFIPSSSLLLPVRVSVISWSVAVSNVVGR